MINRQTALAFLLGAVVVIGTLLVIRFTEPPKEVQAEVGGDFVAVAGNYQSQNRDVLWVLAKDPQGFQKLLIYDYTSNRLNLVAARNIAWDMWLDEHGNQNPKVIDIWKKTKPKHKQEQEPK